MRFLHIGDLHLGRSIGEFDLIEDQKYILDQILDIAKQRAVDAVLIAGDVYDKSIPSEAAVRLLDYFIRRLAGERLPAFLISGNHDSDERMNFGSSLFRANGIYIAAKYEGELLHLRARKAAAGLEVCAVEQETGAAESKVCEAEPGNSGSADEVNIYLMPFIKASQVRHFFPEEKIENYEDAVRAVLKKAGVDPAQRNVLVAHQFVVGSTSPILSGSEGIATQNVGLVEKIGADCFDAFDYVALGHIHSPQAVGREEVRYSGSPLKYSLSEANHVKSMPVVTLGKKGEVQVELVPLRPMRDLRHIRGRMEQLLAKENITAQDDFMYVTLTDEDVIDEAMGIFQQYYPNTIRIEYDNSHTKEMQEMETAYVTPDASFDDLIAGFYRQIYGCDISAEERKLMRETAREAGLEIGEDEILPADYENRTEIETDKASTGNEKEGLPEQNEATTGNKKEGISAEDETLAGNKKELVLTEDEASAGNETGDGGDAN